MDPSPARKYHPLIAKFPMSWPPRGCNWCSDDEMVWAYPVGHVTFPRVNPADGIEIEVPHHAQQWYACARCKRYIEANQLEDLADRLGRPHGYWDRLMEARLKGSKGFPWAARSTARR
ncbi:hypothetical protein FNV58_00895 (plasmid) [Streptomyces sp. RLB1-9]|uniref:hypothetical protein n=1 Tax=Streptomyces sp. RLB1-9 TaxID=2594454 RepID=UPI0011646C05|nr:hypothetical protein [Streptomyces sp. RLB1-9]QDN94917.1 hypothetical protein FNV58_00895 [Streptomyces sp. RLB1-9]